MGEREIVIEYHENQLKIFNDRARFKVIAKGRRFGLTKGMGNYMLERAFGKRQLILWVDTIYPNISRYIERYIMPILIKYPRELWKWNKQTHEIKIENEKGISIIDFRSADRPENIEGFGYNLIILNEAGIILKNRRLWSESIRPMMMDYEADAIIGGTPKGKIGKHGEKHLFYELYLRGKNDKEKAWKSFQFSSYRNPLLNEFEVREMEREMSPALAAQEIYGEFIDELTAEIIKTEWWKIVEYGVWEREKIEGVYQSWDTAFKTNEENDYSVCTTWIVTESNYYLINMLQKRMEFPELKDTVIYMNGIYQPREIIIEDKASGISLIQELQRGTRLPIKSIKVDKDKISRVHAITPLIANGKVKIVRGEWTDKVIRECAEFPGGEYDDIVDSISQFLNYHKKSGGKKRSVIHVKRKVRTRFGG